MILEEVMGEIINDGYDQNSSGISKNGLSKIHN